MPGPKHQCVYRLKHQLICFRRAQDCDERTVCHILLSASGTRFPDTEFLTQLFNSKILDVVKSQILVYRLTQHARQLKQSYLTELTWIRTCECRVTYHAHRYPPASLPALDQQTQAAIFPPASPLNTSTAFTPIKNLGMRYVETDGWSFQIDGSHCSFKYRIEIEWNGALRASSVSFPRAEGNTSFLSELSKTQFD